MIDLIWNWFIKDGFEDHNMKKKKMATPIWEFNYKEKQSEKFKELGFYVLTLIKKLGFVNMQKLE